MKYSAPPGPACRHGPVLFLFPEMLALAQLMLQLLTMQEPEHLLCFALRACENLIGLAPSGQEKTHICGINKRITIAFNCLQ